MEQHVGIAMLLLSLICAVSALDLGRMVAMGMERLRGGEIEQPQIVEVIRWRQPVCLTAAPGVLPCLVGWKQVQPGVQKDKPSETTQSNRESEGEDAEDDRKLQEQSAGADEDETQSTDSLDAPSMETDRAEQSSRTKRSAESSRLISSRIVRTASLESVHPWRLENTEERGGRHGRYLRIASKNVAEVTKKNESKKQVIYVTKVVDSPVTATLVAQTCLPDIGIPLCDDKYIISQKPVVVHQPTNTWTVTESHKPQKPGGFQGLQNYLQRPNVVVTNEQPEVKPVIVVQPTPKPGIFDGLASGGWFNLFNRPSSQTEEVVVVQGPIQPAKPPKLPIIVEVPERPTIQEILYKPENDISDTPGLLDFVVKPEVPDASVVVAPHTEKPGIFGGLFASPSKPVGLEPAVATAPSLFQGIGNIFNRPTTNKPLIIDGPDEKPLVLEKPVYVVEKPAVGGGLLDIFAKPENKPDLDHLPSIKDPVYVLQKPTERPSLFGNGGLLGNLVNFNKPSAKPEAESEVAIVVETPAPLPPAIAHHPHPSTVSVVAVEEPLTQLDPISIGYAPPAAASYHPVAVPTDHHSSSSTSSLSSIFPVIPTSGIVGIDQSSVVGVIGHLTGSKNSENPDAGDDFHHVETIEDDASAIPVKSTQSEVDTDEVDNDDSLTTDSDKKPESVARGYRSFPASYDSISHPLPNDSPETFRKRSADLLQNFPLASLVRLPGKYLLPNE